MKSIITAIIIAMTLTGCSLLKPKVIEVEKEKIIYVEREKLHRCPKFPELIIYILPDEILYPDFKISYEDDRVVILERSEYDKLITSSVMIYDALVISNNQAKELNKLLKKHNSIIKR